MNILLIGGTGTLSTETARQIVLDKNNKLYVVARGSRNKVIPKGAVTIVADAKDEQSLREKLSPYSFDVVVDFTCMTPDDLHIVLNAIEGKYKHFLFMSSCAVYDTKKEECLTITENTKWAINKEWFYPNVKQASEVFINNYFAGRREKYTIIRPCVTYNELRIPYALEPSPRVSNWTIINRILHDKPIVMWGSGDYYVSFTDVRDFSKGLIATFMNEKAYGEAYHITTNKYYTYNDALIFIGKALNKKVNIINIPMEYISKFFPEYELIMKDDKSLNYICDNSKIVDICPELMECIELELGMKNVVEYYMSHKSDQINNSLWDLRMDFMIRSFCKNANDINLVNLKPLVENKKFSIKEYLLTHYFTMIIYHAFNRLGIRRKLSKIIILKKIYRFMIKKNLTNGE